jgi:hypothetical protein
MDFSALVNINGTYILNGNFIVSAFHKELHISGTILEYTGSGSKDERINGTGMIFEDIYVHVRAILANNIKACHILCCSEL